MMFDLASLVLHPFESRTTPTATPFRFVDFFSRCSAIYCFNSKPLAAYAGGR